MAEVAGIVAAYEQALAEGEHATAAKLLEALESPDFLNQRDWEAIQKFLVARGLAGRLELITKRFINSARLESSKPFFVVIPYVVKSGRRAEALELLKQYRERFGDLPSSRWDYVNLLFAARAFKECLVELQTYRQEQPDHFGFVRLEVAALVESKQHFAARKKLWQLLTIIGDDPVKWQWILFTAIQLNDRPLIVKSHDGLLKLVVSRKAIVSPRMIEAFIESGNRKSVDIGLALIEVDDYKTTEELGEIFDVALHYGASSNAVKLGKAILERDPCSARKPKIEELLNRRLFLIPKADA